MTTTSEETLEGHAEPEPHGVVTSADELSDDTRSLMEGMIKESLTRDPEDEEPAEAPAAEEARAEAAAETPATEEPPAAEPVVDTSAHTDSMAKLAAREKEIDEKRLEMREAEKRITEHQQKLEEWKTDRISTLRGVMEVAGITDPEAQKAELATLYEEMTYNVLGVEPDAETSEAKKARAENARLKHQFEAFQKERAEADTRRTEEAEQAEVERQVGRAVESIGGYLSDSAHERPFLMVASSEPSKVIWSVLSEAAEQGQEITLKEAADKAEAHFKTEAEKYRSLLTTNDKAEQPEPSKQEAPASKQGAQSLTNTGASAAAPPTPKVKPGDMDDPDEAREASWNALQKMRKAAESAP